MVTPKGVTQEFVAEAVDCKIMAATDGEDKKQIFRVQIAVEVEGIDDYGAFIGMFDGNPVRISIRSLGPGGSKVTFDENLRDTHQKPKKVKGASDVLVNSFKVNIARNNIANLEAFANMLLTGRIEVSMGRLQTELGLDDKPKKPAKK